MAVAVAPHVWVTRARPGADLTAAALRQHGFSALVVPLLEIRYLAPVLPEPAPAGVVFTSRAGVEGYARLTAERQAEALCVGDNTASAARAAGFDKVRSASGDARALFEVIRAGWPTEAPLCVASAREPAAPLTEWLRAAGFSAEYLAVYESVATEARPSGEDLAHLDYVLLQSAKAAAIAGAFFHAVSHENEFKNLTFACMSEAVARSLRQALAASANEKVTGSAARLLISPFPDEASLLKVLGPEDHS